MTKASNSRRDAEAGLELVWSRRWTLVHRILAVNLLVVLIFALGILWLDAYRNQLREERITMMGSATRAAAAAAQWVDAGEREAMLAAMAGPAGPRFRLYDGDGELVADSWSVSGPTYRLRNPDQQTWQKNVARALDDGFNALVGEAPTEDYVEPATDRANAWPELAEARGDRIATRVRNAPERTPVFSAAAQAGMIW